jgi:hypothetical protein
MIYLNVNKTLLHQSMQLKIRPPIVTLFPGLTTNDNGVQTFNDTGVLVKNSSFPG